MMSSRKPFPRAFRLPSPAKQQGFIFVLSLIILVAITLVGIAVVRSSGSAGGISVAFGFKKSTLMSSDRVLEAGINWLDANRNILIDDCPGMGYYANAVVSADYAGSATASSADDINWTRATGSSANSYVTGTGTGNCALSSAVTGSHGSVVAVFVDPGTGAADPSKTLSTASADSAGNIGSYVIQRLCDGSGAFSASTTISCAGSSTSSSSGASTGAVSYGSYSVTGSTQIYYRITAKTMGPRGAATYTQAKVLVGQ